MSATVETTETILSEKDIVNLMRLLQSYSSKWNPIGLNLGFTSHELDTISSMSRLFNMAPVSYLQELLSQWVQWPTTEHPNNPTLEALCSALQSPLAGLGSLAKDVEKEIKQCADCIEQDCRKRTREQASEEVSHRASEDVEDAELPPKRKHTKEEVELHPASDEKDHGQKDDRSIISEVQKLTLSPEIEEDLRQKIHSDIEIMRHKFSALQTTIRKNVKKNVDHKDFAAHVFGMYILSEEHQKQVANASTVDDIFNILTKYWSFLDFSNLEDIAKNVYHESDTEKQIEQDTEKEKKQGTGEQIEQYKKDVQQFCERRVSEFPPGSLNNGTDSEGMDKLVVTLDLHDPSLKHVLRLKEVIANILGQPASKLVLYDIGSGSVVLTFLIATLLGEELFMKTSNTLTLTQKQKDKLLEVNVVSLEFKEVTLFSIHQERKSGYQVSVPMVPYHTPSVQSGQLIPQQIPSVVDPSVQAEQVLTKRDIVTLLNLVHIFSDKWRVIGLGLGFAPSELNQISSNPSLFMSAPASYLTQLLSQWVQWPTVNHPTKPTVRALCETLRSSLVGLGSLAQEVERKMKTIEEIRLREKDVVNLMRLLQNYSYKWNPIGLNLGFTPHELCTISCMLTLLVGAPVSYLQELLNQWVQWPTTEHPNNPTLEALCAALRSPLVGLGRLAEEVEKEMKQCAGLVQHSIDESCSQTSQKLTAVQPRVTREREEKGKPRSVEVSSGFDSTPDLAQLLVLRTPEGSKIKIISRMAPFWRDLGFLMNFDKSGTEIETIEKKYRGDPKECCRAIFQHWINGNGVKPCSWRKLIELIDDCDQEALAKEIQTAMSL